MHDNHETMNHLNKVLLLKQADSGVKGCGYSSIFFHCSKDAFGEAWGARLRPGLSPQSLGGTNPKVQTETEEGEGESGEECSGQVGLQINRPQHVCLNSDPNMSAIHRP